MLGLICGVIPAKLSGKVKIITHSHNWTNCAEELTGDQKWLLWSLEKYLDL